MTELFDTAVTSLLHLPEVLDRLAAADGDRRSGGHHAAHHHGHARVHGLGGGGGGGAPVDIVETPGEYTFVLDVPGLSKSDIQVRTCVCAAWFCYSVVGSSPGTSR
jgi:HSP20 family protein